jgi:hypothetical protein
MSELPKFKPPKYILHTPIVIQPNGTNPSLSPKFHFLNRINIANNRAIQLLYRDAYHRQLLKSQRNNRLRPNSMSNSASNSTSNSASNSTSNSASNSTSNSTYNSSRINHNSNRPPVNYSTPPNSPPPNNQRLRNPSRFMVTAAMTHITND